MSPQRSEPWEAIREELHEFCRAQKASATLQNFLAWAELLLGKGCLRNRVSEDTRAQGTTPADTWEATFLSKCANKKLKSAASKNHSFGVRMKTHFGAPSTNAH